MTHLHQAHTRRTSSSRVGTKQISLGGTRRSGRSGRGSRDIDALGVLRSARVILPTGGLAGGVTLGTVVDALVVGFGADVVGDCLGVLGCVGRDVVAADALVDEGVLEYSGKYKVFLGGAFLRIRTAEQSFTEAPVDPGTCRQSRGQVDVWSRHQASGVFQYLCGACC